MNAWLIENRGGGELHYLRILSAAEYSKKNLSRSFDAPKPNVWTFTRKASEAVMFARKEDAINIMWALGLGYPKDGDWLLPAEHEFVEPPAPIPAQEE